MELLLGPVLRYVDATSATVWMETSGPCEADVLGRRAGSFSVEGHHFALVVLRDLEPGGAVEYEVSLDGRRVWPPPDAVAPSTIRTPAPGAPLQLAFGSCREFAPHEPPHALPEGDSRHGHGIDALRALAVELAGADGGALPDLLLMLGDQLYADEPPRQLSKALRRRHDRPDGEVRASSFADYALLYREAWSDPAVRWLLSTVPSMMIFDDHEILDEWKISAAWLRERQGDPGYRRRVRAGLMAYWIYQHLGNLPPADVEDGGLLSRLGHDRDLSAPLRALADQADRQAGLSRWSFHRDLGSVRILVLDSRASRRLEPGDRRILDDAEWEWARNLALESGGVDHLILASSLPFLLPAGLHHLEAAVEKLGDGARGRWAARAAERLRRALNLGHWASFQQSFARLLDLLDELAARSDGGPASVLLLSGDIHHGYAARLGGSGSGGTTPVWQLVSSPFRKRLAGYERTAMRFGESDPVTRAAARLARAAGADSGPARWRLAFPASYANQVGRVELAGRTARARLQTPEGSDWRDPRLKTLWELELT